MADLKTQQTNQSVSLFLESIEPARRRDEARELDRIFRAATGWEPSMWGPSVVGYGAYDYTYSTGRSGRWLATGFSPRKANLSIYIMPGYTDFGEILARLGPHKMGKSCLYLRKLEAVDEDVLTELIRAGLQSLAKIWPVDAR